MSHADHYVAKVGNTYHVTVIYDRGQNTIRTGSFAVLTQDASGLDVTWSLVSPGIGDPATFVEENPIRQLSSTDSVALSNIKRVSATYATATLDIKEQSLTLLSYQVVVVPPAPRGGVLTHDPSIIVSHDPVEIP